MTQNSCQICASVFHFLFQVNLEGNKVRRQNPIGDVPENVESRTVYVVKRVLCPYLNLIFTEMSGLHFLENSNLMRSDETVLTYLKGLIID